MSYAIRRKALWTLFLFGLLLLAIASRATTLARLSFDELAVKATAIVRARCLASSSIWRNGEIWTETEFEVLEIDKGTSPGVLRISLPGGKVAHIQSRIDSVPGFREGEEAYLFLWNAPGKEVYVLGWAQGTFRISRDARTGLRRVTQDSAAVPVFDTTTRQFRTDGVRNLSLAAFQIKLKKALARAHL
jgi:hypothetical protein